MIFELSYPIGQEIFNLSSQRNSEDFWSMRSVYKVLLSLGRDGDCAIFMADENNRLYDYDSLYSVSYWPDKEVEFVEKWAKQVVPRTSEFYNQGDGFIFSDDGKGW